MASELHVEPAKGLTAELHHGVPLKETQMCPQTDICLHCGWKLPCVGGRQAPSSRAFHAPAVSQCPRALNGPQSKVARGGGGMCAPCWAVCVVRRGRLSLRRAWQAFSRHRLLPGQIRWVSNQQKQITHKRLEGKSRDPCTCPFPRFPSEWSDRAMLVALPDCWSPPAGPSSRGCEKADACMSGCARRPPSTAWHLEDAQSAHPVGAQPT